MILYSHNLGVVNPSLSQNDSTFLGQCHYPNYIISQSYSLYILMISIFPHSFYMYIRITTYLMCIYIYRYVYTFPRFHPNSSALCKHFPWNLPVIFQKNSLPYFLWHSSYCKLCIPFCIAMHIPFSHVHTYMFVFFLFDDNSSILGISSVSVDSSPIIVAARCCYVVKIMVAKLLYKTDGRGWDIRHGFPKIFWLPMRSPESPEIRSSCPAANCGSWSTRWWCRCWIGADSQQGQPEMWSSDGYGIQMGELCG